MEERGGKLAKFHAAVDTSALRSGMSAREIVGFLAAAAGLRPTEAPTTPAELLPAFTWESVSTTDRCVAWTAPKLTLRQDDARPPDRRD
ncbi:MAG: hypothetical protein GY937_29225 [bacterium]|nr:hypothetical protein [bacterium]